MLAKLSLAGAVLLAAAGLAGCGSHRSAQSATSPSSSLAPATSSASGPGPSSPASQPATPSSSASSIPPYLCEATDQAQNAADAYMGALSAGNEKQAVECVLPGTVPLPVTRSLLATVKGTAVYLPRDGVDGPTVFGYQGNGKSIDVTVTKQSDGRYWVTRVVVRGG